MTALQRSDAPFENILGMPPPIDLATIPEVHNAVPVGRARLFATIWSLYLAQSIPIYLIVTAIPPILRELGVSRASIGLLWIMMLPFVIRFLWAPMVDRLSPLKGGHRRGWILPTQLGIVFALMGLSFADPSTVWPIYIFGIVVAILASTQDIASDGYATRMLAPCDRPLGNAIQGSAVAVGVVLSSALSLVIYHRFGWQPMILVVAALSTLPLLAVVAMPEDAGDMSAAHSFTPSLKGFFMRPEACQVFAIALVYRAGDGLIKAMEGPYLIDLAVPLSWIGYLNGSSAALAGIGGSFLVALVAARIGRRAMLGGLACLRTICFAVFAGHAAGVLDGTWTILGASMVNTLLGYMEIVALYSLYMTACSKEQPGTDFTILSCATLAVYLGGSAIAGVFADARGYAELFTVATCISALATWLTLRLMRNGPVLEARLSEVRN
jgi:MFS transporter (putative signal transducer)